MVIIESGIIVAAGLSFTFAKLDWRTRVWFISHPLFVDICVFILLNILHWGTFSGVMVAATGALVCSGLISLARWFYGHVDKGVYHPGKRNIAVHLMQVAA